MKINCCWLYAISKYGYPPSIADTQRALGEMAALGFNAVELEGVREENLRAVWPRVGERVSSTDAVRALSPPGDDARVGVVLASGRLHAQKEVVRASGEKLGARILYVHASANDGRDNGSLGPGRGTVDWKGL